MNTKNKYLVWIDTEFTGLDILNEKLLEIAVVITDYNLHIIDTIKNLYIH